MKRLLALATLTILVLSTFVALLPSYAQVNLPESGESLELVSASITGSNSSGWQRDTQFTQNGKIDVDGGKMILDFEQESFLWYSMTKYNSTYVVHEQRNPWFGGIVQYICKNNLENEIKCWLRGSVTTPRDYRIGVEGGIWYPEHNIYIGHGYQFNLTDVAEYGFPIRYDEDTSELVIGVSGTFDIDPTITSTSIYANYRRDDVTVTVGHFNYIFYKTAVGGSSIQYMYKNASEVGWQNGTKVYATNRTYATHNNYLQKTGDTFNQFAHVFKSNGTHIYGYAQVKSGQCGGHSSDNEGRGMAGCFLLFNVTQAGSVHNVTDGYNVGSLVLHTNASVPCLGAGGSCGGADWDSEAGGTGAFVTVDVAMNSTGFPMVIWKSDIHDGGTNTYNPWIMVSIAENPVGATCTEKSDFSQRACNQNDARNGKNGTWTNAYQIDTNAKIIAGGSGHRYSWSAIASGDAISQHQWETATCSMGSGNMLIVQHNKSKSGNHNGAIWGRLWYQSNATWGTAFPIYDVADVSDGGSGIRQDDEMDLSCAPDSSGTMTAHLAWTDFSYDTAVNASGRVWYTNLTSASYTNSEDSRALVRQFNHAYWAQSVAISVDNSTGTIAIFYHSNEGLIYSNFTGYYGTIGFGKIQGILMDTGITTTDYDLEFSLQAAPHWNGTATDSSGSVFLVYSADPGTEIAYGHWLNRSISSTLMFYDQQGAAVTMTNMTFTSNYNGSQLTVSDCSTCYTALKSGTYVVNYLYRNNADMNINSSSISTTFYIDMGNRTASFIVGNLTITFSVKDEKTLEDWNVGAKPIQADVWLNNEKVSYTINSNDDLRIFVPSSPSRVALLFGSSLEFARFDTDPSPCMIAGCDIQLSFYLADYSGYIVRDYTFNLNDPTVGVFDNGTMRTKKYLSTGLTTLDHQDIPLDQAVIISLIEGEEYVLTVYSQDGTSQSDIGFFTPTADTTINVNIQKVEFAPEQRSSQKYVLFSASRSGQNVTIYFKDLAAETTTVTFNIVNSSGIQYTNTYVSPTELTVLWQGADTNLTHSYWVQMIASNDRFGAISETKPAYNNYINSQYITLLYTETGESLLPQNSAWYVYVAMMIIIFTAGMFSVGTANIAGFVIALIGAMFYLIGWMPGANPIMIAVITLMSFLWMLGNRKVSG